MPALIDGVREVSREELDELIGVRREALAAEGKGPGVRVVLGCRPDVATVVEQQALLALGAMIVPVAATLTEEERRRVVAACATGPAPPGAVLGMLSSGSTGTPKLVLHDASSLAAGIDVYRCGLGVGGDDRVLALVPLEHGFGFRMTAAVLAAGACLVLPGPVAPRLVVERAAALGVTLLPASPRFLELCVRTPRPGVRAAIAVGGMGVAAHRQVTAWLGAPVWQSYGASECGVITVNRDGAADGELLALGVPHPGVDVALEDGEIVVRAPSVGIGYEGTHDGASRIEDRAFFTGDLGAWVDGELCFRGRRKLLIDTGGGHKVDPAEVEEIVRRHPDVRDAAIVAGEGGVKVILVADRPVPLLELTAFCSRWLSPHKVPREIELRDALPRDVLGKLRRDRL